MNLRYHKIGIEEGEAPYRSDNRCLSIVSMPPQQRSILIHGTRNTMRVWYPYTTFTLEYFRVPGGFVYYGQPRRAFHVFFSNKPINSFDDIVSYSPTDNGAVICTDHSWDNTVFKKPRTLIGTVLELYWSMGHHITMPYNGGKYDAWSEFTAEQCLSFQWYTSNHTLGAFCNVPEKYKTPFIDAPLGRLPSVLRTPRANRVYGVPL